MTWKKLKKEELEKLKKENPVAYLREEFYEIKYRENPYREEIIEMFKNEKKPAIVKQKKIAAPRDPETEV